MTTPESRTRKRRAARRARAPGAWGGLLAALLCASAGRPAQEATTQPASAPAPQSAPQAEPAPVDALAEATTLDVTAEAVQDRIRQIEGDPDLSEASRAELLTDYRQALDQIGLAESWEARIAEYRRGIDDAPGLLEAVRARLAQAASQPTTSPELGIDPGAGLDQLAARLAELEGELKSAQERVRRLDDESKNRAERKSAIPELLADANRRLESVQKSLSSGPPPGSGAQAVLARRTMLLAQRQAIEQELRAYEEELRFYNARSDLLAARREEARLAVVEAQARVAAMQALVSERRQAEIEHQKRQAEQELERTPQAVRELARQNAELVAERSAVAQRIDLVRASLAQAQERAAEVDRDFAYVRENVDSEFIGPRMRRARERVYALRSWERDRRANRDEFARVQGRIAALTEERFELTDLERRVADVLRSLAPGESAALRSWIEPRVRELLASRRELLDRLARDYESYQADLTQLGTQQTRLLAKVAELGDFIDRHVLWTRSTGPVYSARLPEEWPVVGQRFVALLRSLRVDLGRQPALYALAGALVLGLLAVRRRGGAALRRIRERVARVYTDSIAHTLRALGWTLVMALPWPVLLWFIGWRLRAAPEVLETEVYELSQALGTGFAVCAGFALMLSLVHRLCAPHGVAEAHFRWNPDALRLTRANLRWLTAVVIPAVLLVATAERQSAATWRESLGQVVFIVGMLAVSLFVQRVLHPGRGVFAERFARSRGGWLYELRYLWYPAAVLTPLLFAAVSFAGYQYTAVELSKRLVRTVWLALVVAVLHATLVRWLAVAQRRLAIEQLRRKRAAETERKEAADQPAADDLPEAQEEKPDIVSIGEQTRKLLHSLTVLVLALGAWFVWSDMLPALRFFDDVRLWQYATERAQPGGEGGAGTVIRSIEYITLAHVAMALIVAVVTYVLARNIPGLLEIAILQKLPLDAGGRFACAALARYLIVVVGVVVAFSSIGVSWSSVQWLVAAVTVGLGFGLQEIFANFVSGLIILFERPIRVGDVVTVSGTSGTVTRIRIRATTITDWDRKELIIPNREFVTGHVINWTLSDDVMRLVFKVGAAYGSDPRRVQRVLLTVAEAHPLVLKEPPPRVVFSAFGESALEFELFAFVNVANGPTVRNELHTAIADAFRDAGIEIPFPQREVHIRTVAPQAGALAAPDAVAEPPAPARRVRPHPPAGV